MTIFILDSYNSLIKFQATGIF